MTAVPDYDDFVAVLRARADEIGLSHATLDALTGMPSGYTGKVLGPSRVRVLSGWGMFLYVEALALRVELVPDLEAAQRMERRWEKRDELRRRPGVIRKRFSPELKAKVLQEMMAEIGNRATAEARSHGRKQHLPRARRREIARKAANARWAKRISRPRTDGYNRGDASRR